MLLTGNEYFPHICTMGLVIALKLRMNTVVINE